MNKKSKNDKLPQIYHLIRFFYNFLASRSNFFASRSAFFNHFSNCSQYIMKEGLKKIFFLKGKKIVVFFLSYCHFVKKYHIK